MPLRVNIRVKSQPGTLDVDPPTSVRFDTTVTFLAGAPSAALSIPTIDDDFFYGRPRSISARIIRGDNYIVPPEPNNSAALRVDDNDARPRVVELTGSTIVSESGPAISVNVKLDQPFPRGTPEEQRRFEVTYGGTATSGDDYAPITSFIFPVGESDALIERGGVDGEPLRPIDDTVRELTETIIITIDGVTHTIKLVDNEPYDVTLSPSTATVAEGDSVNLTARIDRPWAAERASGGPLVLRLGTTGTATPGRDFRSLERRRLTIAAGQTSVGDAIAVASLADNEVEAPETVVVKAESETTNIISSTSTVTITDVATSPPVQRQSDPPPSVDIVAEPETNQPSETATFRFSEPVAGFTLGDITVGNGVASNFRIVDAATYQATITPSASPERVRSIDVTIDVAAGVAEEAPPSELGQLNTAAEQVTIRFINVPVIADRTPRIIRNFLTRRADQITTAEPDLVRRLNRGDAAGGLLRSSRNAGPIGLSGSGSAARGRMKFATSLRRMIGADAARKASKQAELMANAKRGNGPSRLGVVGMDDLIKSPFDVWAEGHWSHADDETTSSNFGVLFVGADYRWSENAIVGLLAQFDWADEEDDLQEFRANGSGWMIGPYLAARLHQNLILDGRLAWGRSSNDVSPFATYTDNFETTRWLAKAQVTGQFNVGKLHIAPHLGVIYFQEHQDAYTDHNGIAIGSQTVEFGRLTFGPKFATSAVLADGTLVSPYLSVSGIWDFARTAIVDPDTGEATAENDDLRARAEAGVSMVLPSGMSVAGEAFYDGLGSDTLEAYGGRVTLSIPFNNPPPQSTDK